MQEPTQISLLAFLKHIYKTYQSTSVTPGKLELLQFSVSFFRMVTTVWDFFEFWQRAKLLLMAFPPGAGIIHKPVAGWNIISAKSTASSVLVTLSLNLETFKTVLANGFFFFFFGLRQQPVIFLGARWRPMRPPKQDGPTLSGHC